MKIIIGDKSKFALILFIFVSFILEFVIFREITEDFYWTLLSSLLPIFCILFSEEIGSYRGRTLF